MDFIKHITWNSLASAILYFALFLFVVSCEKDPDGKPFPNNDNNNRTIEVTLHHVFDTILFTDSVMANVEVKIYSSYDQFITDGPADAIRYSDSTGVALFEYRSANYYWIKCFHPAHGFITDSVSTPSHTVAFVQLYYYF
ncbi:MAG: hypothetical protein WAU21_06280 [Chitinophagales bacterium]|nr:hypothetical protein [Bacteroidota bacterium]MBP9190773.1 hypothetical protein [Chitinophagales bacterium]